MFWTITLSFLMTAAIGFAADPELSSRARQIAERREQMRSSPGYWELRNGQYGTMVTCQVEIASRAPYGEFADFADFFDAGGEGTLFELTSAIPNFQSEDRGFYVEITQLPAWNENSTSRLLFLRDRRAYDLVARRIAGGTPVFLRPTTHPVARVGKRQSAVMEALFIHTKNEDRYYHENCLVLSRDAHYYILVHEQQHYDDLQPKNAGFLPTEYESRINHLLQSDELSRVVDFLSDVGPLYEFVMEQRADVARLEALKRDIRENPQLKVTIRSPRTEHGVTEISLEIYRVFLRAELSIRLAHDGNSYGRRVHEFLKGVQAKAPDQVEVIRSLLREGTLPSEELSFDQLIPPL